MDSFEEQGSFLKNQLTSLVPPWNTGFYACTLKNLVFTLFAYNWIFFEGIVSLWVSLTQENISS